MPAEPRSRTKIPLASLALVCLGVLGGCHKISPVIPKGWEPASRDVTRAVLRSNASQSKTDPRLQVFISYAAFMTNHSALRLTCPARPTVIWDPGGEYGEGEFPVGRRADLISIRTPGVDAWWRYRRKYRGDRFMEVFEWKLDATEAQTLHRDLVVGSVERVEGFYTDRNGGFCTVAVSSFLQKYAVPRIRLQEPIWWPHNLGGELWRQNPQRVTLYRRDKEPTVYVRSRPRHAAHRR